MWVWLKELGFLGHVISGEGIAVYPTKVQSVTDWLAPTSVGEICSFLWLVGYYRRIIENFSKIVKPMTELLKKDAEFKWTDEFEASFQELKKCLVIAPMLILPDIRKDFQVYCDAYRLGLGGVMQSIPLSSPWTYLHLPQHHLDPWQELERRLSNIRWNNWR